MVGSKTDARDFSRGRDPCFAERDVSRPPHKAPQAQGTYVREMNPQDIRP